MDSLAYSVMLEVKANTSNLNKDLQKSLTIANDYHKQMQKNFDGNTKAVKGYINAHSGLNKVYKEELGWWDKIGHAVGSTIKFILTLPIQAAKAIAGMSISVIKAVSTAIVGSIGYVDKYINDAMGKYDELIEEYRFANIQAAGGVGLLHDRMTELMATTGATREEAKKIAFGLAIAGFRAKEMGKDFGVLTETLWGFERITGVSAETSASLAKSLDGIGFSADSTRKMFVGLAKQAHASNLTTSEMTEIANNLKEEMYDLAFAFDQEAVEKYSKALGELAGSAKMVGVNVSKATQLMSELNRNPLKFVVALGSDAFYRSASDNMETLITNLDRMRSTLQNVPPGLKPQLLKDIYGIDTATFKMLEGMEEFRKKYPAIKKWGDMLEEANSSLDRMYKIIFSKVMAVFERLAQRFQSMRIDFLKAFVKDIPEKIQNLFAAISNLIDKVFNTKLLGDWGETATGWVQKLNQWFGELIDGANRWITAFSQPENIALIKYYISEASRIITTKIIPGVISLAGTIKDFVLKGLEIMLDIISKVYTKFMEWVDGGGPKRLHGYFVLAWDTLVLVYDTISTIAEAFFTVGKVIYDYLLSPLGKLVIGSLGLIFDIVGYIGDKMVWLGGKIVKYVSGPLGWVADKLSWAAKKLGIGGGEVGVGKKSAVEGAYNKGIPAPKGAARVEENKLLSGISDLGSILKEGFTELSGISRNTKETVDQGNKIAEKTNELLKKREEIAEKPLSKMGWALRDIGKEFHDTKTNTIKKIDFNKEIENQLDHLRTMARYRGEKFDEASSRKKLKAQAGEEFERLFGKTFKHTKDSGFAKESGLKGKALDEAAIKWSRSLLTMSRENLEKSDMFKKMNVEQKNAVIDANDVFTRFAKYGNSDVDYLDKTADMKNKFVQKVLENDKQLLDQAKKKAELAAKAAKEEEAVEDAIKKVREAKKGKATAAASETPAGAVAGAKAEHVAVATPTFAGIPIFKIDKESLGDLEKMVAVNEEQVGLLSSIDHKIGKKLYDRNNPDNQEVTSTIWGT